MKNFTISALLTLIIHYCFSQDTLPYYFQCLPCAPEYGDLSKLKFLDDSTSAFIGDFLETDCFSDLKGVLLLKNGEIINPPQPTIPYYAEDFAISDIVKFDGKYIAAGSVGIQDISTWTNLDSLNVEVVGTNYFKDRIKLVVDTSLNLLYWGSGEIESVNGSVINKSFGYYDGTAAHLIDVPFPETYGFISLFVPEPGILWLQPDGGSMDLYEYNYYTGNITIRENPLSVSAPFGSHLFDDFKDSSFYLYESHFILPDNQLAKYKNGVWSDSLVTWGIQNIFQGPDDYVFMTGCFDYYCEINFGTIDFPVLTPAVLKNTMLPYTAKGIFNSGEYYIYGYMEDVMDDCETFGKLVDTIIIADIEEITKEINIYPNPVSGLLYLDIPIGNNTIEINLRDESGKIVKKLSPTEKHLNVLELPEGMYFITILSNESFISLKIIKTE